MEHERVLRRLGGEFPPPVESPPRTFLWALVGLLVASAAVLARLWVIR